MNAKKKKQIVNKKIKWSQPELRSTPLPPRQLTSQKQTAVSNAKVEKIEGQKESKRRKENWR